MSKKIFVMGMFVLLVLSLSACGDQVNPENESNGDNESAVKEVENEMAEDSNLAVNFELVDGVILTVDNVEGLKIENTPYSTSENVIVYINEEEKAQEGITVPGFATMMVVSDSAMKARVEQVKSDYVYEDELAEYLAINSSTQCAILKPADLTKTETDSRLTWQGTRQDFCSFGLYSDNPRDEAKYYLGFQENGYTVVIYAQDEPSLLPENTMDLLVKIAEGARVE